jgi:hypothetical protein
MRVRACVRMGVRVRACVCACARVRACVEGYSNRQRERDARARLTALRYRKGRSYYRKGYGTVRLVSSRRAGRM